MCENSRFEGRCVVLRRGSYDSLRSLGLDNRISSVRPFAPERPVAGLDEPPPSAPLYEDRHRPDERLYEAQVTSARAVVGAPEQRCWIERHEAAPQRDVNVPGAVIGGVLGGILGHQVGGGAGKDLATLGAAVGGALFGANVDRIRDDSTGREVRRCANVASTTPRYWDVTYNFRGHEHHVQMVAQPGRTITVDRDGLPRM